MGIRLTEFLRGVGGNLLVGYLGIYIDVALNWTEYLFKSGDTSSVKSMSYSMLLHCTAPHNHQGKGNYLKLLVLLFQHTYAHHTVEAPSRYLIRSKFPSFMILCPFFLTISTPKHMVSI